MIKQAFKNYWIVSSRLYTMNNIVHDLPLERFDDKEAESAFLYFLCISLLFIVQMKAFIKKQNDLITFLAAVFLQRSSDI